MFQTFSAGANPAAAIERVKRLRSVLATAGLAALLVPRGDEHQGEYVAPSSERLAWLTGFSGSAGLAVIARKHAALFVDGRYTVQVKAECDETLFEFPGIARTTLINWLLSKLKRGDVVGFDPWLHTVGEIERLKAALALHGILLKPTARNLVDKVWGRDRPDPPLAPVVAQALKYAGRTAEQKITQLQRTLKTAGQDAVILTAPDSICWLLNIRGGDVAHNPVVLAFAILPVQGMPELFIDERKLTNEARQHLDGVVKISAASDLKARVTALKQSSKRVRLDSERAAFWFKRTLGALAIAGSDPVVPLKAIKNNAEIKGARAAHVRDGAAVVRYLAWLERELGKRDIDEITAVCELERHRAATKALKEISFDTISGSGAHGAIVHYRVSEKTNRTLRTGELFLLDSGAQYVDGTTDITRTLAIGTPSAEMRERFTLVLKGHIAIATARFPKGTRGMDLDPLARRALWERGLDFDHGTGHGVGSYLSVHEGPQSISRAGGTVLEPGMIISNEPGYYKEGAYGIRIESLVLVMEPVKPDGGDREMMSFETLTLVPIDRRLIAKELLSEDEIRWLNAYHARVREVIAPEVDLETKSWLLSATAPL